MTNLSKFMDGCFSITERLPLLNAQYFFEFKGKCFRTVIYSASFSRDCMRREREAFSNTQDRSFFNQAIL
jgi:hypothetical protein